eukprot:1159113-Pelagomonas_calceolata.AAC.15
MYPELHHQHVQGHVLKIIIQLARNSPAPTYLYKVLAGIAGNECPGAISKHQAIQSNDTPADTTFPCVNSEGNPFHDTTVVTWLAFEEAACTHASTPERPDSSVPKSKHSSNHHGNALRTHIHSKHRFGKATNRKLILLSKSTSIRSSHNS